MGKQALEKQLETGVSKRFVQLLVDRLDLETDPWPQGSEIIYRDGKNVGWTTSAAYGFTLGCPVNFLINDLYFCLRYVSGIWKMKTLVYRLNL